LYEKWGECYCYHPTPSISGDFIGGLYDCRHSQTLWTATLDIQSEALSDEGCGVCVKMGGVLLLSPGPFLPAFSYFLYI